MANYSIERTDIDLHTVLMAYSKIDCTKMLSEIIVADAVAQNGCY